MQTEGSTVGATGSAKDAQAPGEKEQTPAEAPAASSASGGPPAAGSGGDQDPEDTSDPWRHF
eukprot:10470714-Lingulodinium_polyedra.AAC.1